MKLGQITTRLLTPHLGAKRIVFTALALSVSTAALAAPKLTAKSAAKPASVTSISTRVSAEDTSYRSCKTLISCAGILERHPSDSFDYSVLAYDFDHFGDKGRKVLWHYVDTAENPNNTNKGSAEAIEIANRALDILSRSAKILSPAGQRRIAGMWQVSANAPKGAQSAFDIDTLAQIMSRNLSPIMRSFAVQTLDSPNADAARLSRVLIDQSLRRNMDFPMHANDFAALRDALQKTPSPMLVALMDKYEPAQSAPVFSQLLRSGDANTVTAAYGALHKASAEDAFKALVATLYDLKPQDGQAALAIAELLVRRSPLRDDGFYMNFAAELSEDKQMSPAARLAGFDALLKLQGEKGAPAIKDSPFTRESFALALSLYGAQEKAKERKEIGTDGIPPAYFAVPQRLDTKQPDVWLAPLKAAAHSARARISLTELSGQYDSPLARSTAQDSFAARGNYLLNISGILALAAQSRPANRELAERFKAAANTHPISLVRAAAKLGAGAALSAAPRKAILKSQNKLAETAKTIDPREAFCPEISRAAPADFRTRAKAMPFYDPAQLSNAYMADRSWLTSGSRHASGWLAGYSRPGAGGLISYQNISGAGEELFNSAGFAPHAVIAVQPTAPVKLGDKARSFWVLAAGLTAQESALYRAAQTPASYSGEARFTLTRHALLPAVPSAVHLSAAGNMTFEMGRVNPPLTLLPNGELRRACAP